MVEKILERAKKMKINEESHYLAIYIMDYYFRENSREFSTQKSCNLFAACFLLLASKMREVDTKTPYAVEIKRMKDECFCSKDVKKTEIKVAQYFDWNLQFLTLFDYLEHCSTLGILLSTDICSKDTIQKITNSEALQKHKVLQSRSSKQAKALNISAILKPTSISPAEEYSPSNNGQSYEEQLTERFGESDTANYITPTKKTTKNLPFKHFVQSNKTIKRNKKESADKTTAKKLSKKDLMVYFIDQPTQKLLAKELTEKCFELAKRVLENVVFTKFNQASMALAIIRYARRELKIHNKTRNINMLWDTLFNIDNTVFLDEYDLLKREFGDPKEILTENSPKTSSLMNIDDNKSFKKPKIDGIKSYSSAKPSNDLVKSYNNIAIKDDKVVSSKKISQTFISSKKCVPEKATLLQKNESKKSYIKNFAKDINAFPNPEGGYKAKFQYLDFIGLPKNNLEESIEVISNRNENSDLELSEKRQILPKSSAKLKSKQSDTQDESNKIDFTLNLDEKKLFYEDEKSAHSKTPSISPNSKKVSDAYIKNTILASKMLGVTSNQSNFKLFNKHSSLLTKCINYSIKSKKTNNLNKSQIDQSSLTSTQKSIKRFESNKPSFEMTNAVHKDTSYSRNSSNYEPLTSSKQQYGTMRNIQSKVSGLNNIRDANDGPIRNSYLTTNNSQAPASKTKNMYSVSGIREINKTGNLNFEEVKKIGASNRNFSKRDAFNTNLSMKLASSSNLNSTNDFYQLRSRTGLQQNADKATKLHRS